MGAEVKLEGFDDLTKKLKEIPVAMRKRVIRNALAGGARLVRDEAKRLAPVLSPTAALKTPYRKSGTVRDAISVRTSKESRKAGDIGVFVNVRPAKGAKFKTKTTRVFGLKFKTKTQTQQSQRGAKSQNDPFYWRFLEFGTNKMPARSYLGKAADKLPAALEIFKASITKWIDKTNASGKVNP